MSISLTEASQLIKLRDKLKEAFPQCANLAAMQAIRFRETSQLTDPDHEYTAVLQQKSADLDVIADLLERKGSFYSQPQEEAA